jgi:glycosyltransferase involved in cell wall biosynthesis
LSELFKAAHFVFVPSKAEAFGMTFAEASAFGVPSVATATGGIPSVVHNGVNGFTLPITADAAEFADLIAGAISDREQYADLCRKSFEEFDKRLNWRVFCARFLEIAHRCCEDLAVKVEGVA